MSNRREVRLKVPPNSTMKLSNGQARYARQPIRSLSLVVGPPPP